MHNNSLDTYYETIDSLSDRRAQVLKTIKSRYPITRQEVSEVMGWKINRITGRVCELIDLGLVVD